jgi:hypothetical protein
MSTKSLRIGTGSSTLDDSAAAGHAAATAALAQLDGVPPALVLVYTSVRYDLDTLIAAIRSVTGDASLAGCTSSGQFVDGEVVDPGEGVIVLVMSAGPYRFGLAAESGLRTKPYDLGRDLVRAAAADVGAQRAKHGAVILLADALGGDLQSLLNGVYKVAGAGVPVVGGAAASDHDLFQPKYVFHNDRVIPDGAVVVWVESDRPLRVVYAHGWEAQGLPLLVTRVEGTVVHELGGRAAIDVYREAFRAAERPEEADKELWEGLRAYVAFGLLEPDGSEVIRAAYVAENNVPHTFSPLPAYGAVRFMTATPDSLLGVCEDLVADALDGTEEPRVLLTFSCYARMAIMQERVVEEAQRLQKAAGPVHTFGFYTCGEFARSTGASGYHNATIAALAL